MQDPGEDGGGGGVGGGARASGCIRSTNPHGGGHISSSSVRAPSRVDIGANIRSHDHRSTLLYQGDGPRILGVPESAPGTGAIQTRLPTPGYFHSIPRDDHVIHREESV
jgi:hypothetical protein